MHGLKSKGFYKHIVATCYGMTDIDSMIFSLQFEVGYPLPAEHIQFVVERILHGLIHSPFPQIVTITLAICDADTQLNRSFLHIPGL